ncbi:hypothetical protein B0T17DRAFT_503296 [Bombardia bombarda]|uniref:Uncharacterized protein n=1 Tax=Bombardia bombarda TaxID=252184 RepID=A0AA39XKP8_9PEZI|nr:hypothetical protein B0T17DRAFT_503296 [Bombardia bombarda]
MPPLRLIPFSGPFTLGGGCCAAVHPSIPNFLLHSAGEGQPDCGGFLWGKALIPALDCPAFGNSVVSDWRAGQGGERVGSKGTRRNKGVTTLAPFLPLAFGSADGQF